LPGLLLYVVGFCSSNFCNDVESGKIVLATEQVVELSLRTSNLQRFDFEQIFRSNGAECRVV
jgi:hypothetical protein